MSLPKNENILNNINSLKYIARSNNELLGNKDVEKMSEQELCEYIKPLSLIFKEKKIAETKRFSKIKDVMKMLEIPYYVNGEDSVRITDLYDILMDDDKFKKIISKLKMKEFW